MTPEERFERIERTLDRFDASMDRAKERADLADKRADRTDARLDRAIRLVVREARNERVKRRELDEKLTQLAAAQVVTEEKMQTLQASVQAFIDSMRSGGNGRSDYSSRSARREERTGI